MPKIEVRNLLILECNSYRMSLFSFTIGLRFLLFLENSRLRTLQHRIEIESHTWTLDVTDDGTGSVVHELDADLGDTTTGA